MLDNEIVLIIYNIKGHLGSSYSTCVHKLTETELQLYAEAGKSTKST